MSLEKTFISAQYRDSFLFLYISGNRSRNEDEACRHHFFTGRERPIYLLADGNSIECPFHGKFVEKPTSTQQMRQTTKSYAGKT